MLLLWTQEDLEINYNQTPTSGVRTGVKLLSPVVYNRYKVVVAIVYTRFKLFITTTISLLNIEVSISSPFFLYRLTILITSPFFKFLLSFSCCSSKF